MVQILNYEWGEIIPNQVMFESEWDTIIVIGNKWQNLSCAHPMTY